MKRCSKAALKDGFGENHKLINKNHCGYQPDELRRLAPDIALEKPRKRPGMKLNSNVWEKRNWNWLDEVGCCKTVSNVPRVNPANHGVAKLTKT